MNVSDILEPEEHIGEHYYIDNPNYIKRLNRDIANNKFSSVNPDIARTLLATQYANQRGNFIHPQRIGFLKTNSQGTRVYNPLFPGVTLCSSGAGMGAKTGLYEIGDNIRKLTPRECARLQGFPETYKINCSDRQAYKQFGNSVAVPCVSAIIREIIKNEKVC